MTELPTLELVASVCWRLLGWARQLRAEGQQRLIFLGIGAGQTTTWPRNVLVVVWSQQKRSQSKFSWTCFFARKLGWDFGTFWSRLWRWCCQGLLGTYTTFSCCFKSNSPVVPMPRAQVEAQETGPWDIWLELVAGSWLLRTPRKVNLLRAMLGLPGQVQGKRHVNRFKHLALYALAVVCSLKRSSWAFGQPSAGEIRERTGHDSRVRVTDAGWRFQWRFISLGFPSLPRLITLESKQSFRVETCRLPIRIVLDILFHFPAQRNFFWPKSPRPASIGTGNRSSRSLPLILARPRKSSMLWWMLHWDVVDMQKEHWFIERVDQPAKSFKRQPLILLLGSLASCNNLNRFGKHGMKPELNAIFLTCWLQLAFMLQQTRVTSKLLLQCWTSWTAASLRSTRLLSRLPSDLVGAGARTSIGQLSTFGTCFQSLTRSQMLQLLPLWWVPTWQPLWSRFLQPGQRWKHWESKPTMSLPSCICVVWSKKKTSNVWGVCMPLQMSFGTSRAIACKRPKTRSKTFTWKGWNSPDCRRSCRKHWSYVKMTRMHHGCGGPCQIYPQKTYLCTYSQYIYIYIHIYIVKCYNCNC